MCVCVCLWTCAARFCLPCTTTTTTKACVCLSSSNTHAPPPTSTHTHTHRVHDLHPLYITPAHHVHTHSLFGCGCLFLSALLVGQLLLLPHQLGLSGEPSTVVGMNERQRDRERERDGRGGGTHRQSKRGAQLAADTPTYQTGTRSHGGAHTHTQAHGWAKGCVPYSSWRFLRSWPSFLSEVDFLLVPARSARLRARSRSMSR
jgi:hypothetical protein